MIIHLILVAIRHILDHHIPRHQVIVQIQVAHMVLPARLLVVLHHLLMLAQLAKLAKKVELVVQIQKMVAARLQKVA